MHKLLSGCDRDVKTATSKLIYKRSIPPLLSYRFDVTILPGQWECSNKHFAWKNHLDSTPPLTRTTKGRLESMCSYPFHVDEAVKYPVKSFISVGSLKLIPDKENYPTRKRMLLIFPFSLYPKLGKYFTYAVGTKRAM